VAVDLVEAIDITAHEVTIQFNVSLRASSITNDKFLVATDEATPVSITDPFDTIDLNEDYNSVSRTLTLHWANDVLTPATDYTLTISGLKNILGQTLNDWVVQFTTGDTVNTALDGLPPAPEEVSIVDYSIVSTVFDTFAIPLDTVTFRFVEADPPNGDYYLPADYHYGRIRLTFSQAPAVTSVNSTNIKVQKKEISRSPARWEDIDARLSQNGIYVYVDLPSVDHYPEAATPAETVVYYTSGYEYFSENYKYRIVISKNLTT
jgi:hypothetical protein